MYLLSFLKVYDDEKEIIELSDVYLNGNNAAEGENNNFIKYASSYPMNWTVKNWFVQDFKGHGHDTDEWHDYDEDNIPFEQLENVSGSKIFRTETNLVSKHAKLAF